MTDLSTITEAEIRKLPDRVFWGHFSGEEFYLDKERGVIAAVFSDIVKPGDYILDLMSGKYCCTPSTVAVDISGRMLRDNKSAQHKVVADLNSQNPTLPFETNSFDIVTMISGIPYLREPQQVFNEAERVLKPGGHFIICYGFANIYERAQLYWLGLDEGQRTAYIRGLYESAGFHEVEYKISGRVVYSGRVQLPEKLQRKFVFKGRKKLSYSQ